MIQYLGSMGLFVVQEMGRMLLFLLAAVQGAFRPPLRLGLIVKRINFIGVKSLFVIALTAAFTGMVLALQGFFTLQKFGAEGLLGSAVALSLIRELGPVLAALMVTGRAGSAMTAEIGIMAITEQIDALRAMAVNPIKYLVVPNLIAGLIAVPLLTALFDLIGIFGGFVVGVKLLGLSSGAYFGQMEASVSFQDISSGFWKSVSFGFLLTLVACYKGYFARHGAEGVSKATTQSVVMASVLILVWDYFMTSLFF